MVNNEMPWVGPPGVGFMFVRRRGALCLWASRYFPRKRMQQAVVTSYYMVLLPTCCPGYGGRGLWYASCRCVGETVFSSRPDDFLLNTRKIPPQDQTPSSPRPDGAHSSKKMSGMGRCGFVKNFPWVSLECFSNVQRLYFWETDEWFLGSTGSFIVNGLFFSPFVGTYDLTKVSALSPAVPSAMSEGLTKYTISEGAPISPNFGPSSETQWPRTPYKSDGWYASSCIFFAISQVYSSM